MKKMKKSYVVLCQRIDCGDRNVSMLEHNGVHWWSKMADALEAMRADYHNICELYKAEDPALWEVSAGEIRLDIPVLNEHGKKDLIRCHWKVVEID